MRSSTSAPASARWRKTSRTSSSTTNALLPMCVMPFQLHTACWCGRLREPRRGSTGDVMRGRGGGGGGARAQVSSLLVASKNIGLQLQELRA